MTPAPIKPEIPLSLLNQIDIRVGTIQSVDDVPGADKLVMLRVDPALAIPEHAVPNGARAG